MSNWIPFWQCFVIMIRASKQKKDRLECDVIALSLRQVTFRGGSRISGMGVHMYNGVGVHFAYFISFVLNIPWKTDPLLDRPLTLNYLTLYMLVATFVACWHSFHTDFKTRSVQTKHLVWYPYILFGTLMVSLKLLIKKKITILSSLSDLNPNCLTLCWYSWNDISKKFILKKKNSRGQKSIRNYPVGK